MHRPCCVVCVLDWLRWNRLRVGLDLADHRKSTADNRVRRSYWLVFE